MRILVVAHAFPPEGTGGTERYADATARGLRARGHDVAVFSGSLEWRETFAAERRDEQGLPVLRLHRSDLYFDHWDKGSEPRVLQWFEQELARFRPDVVHLHHWIRLGDDLVRRAAARGVPTVAHLHDLFVTCPRVFRVKPSRAPLSGPDDLVVCDEALGRAACLSCVPRWKFQSDAEIGASIDRYARELGAELAAAAAVVAPSRAHAHLLAAQTQRPEAGFEVLSHPRLPGGVQGPGTDAKSPAGTLKLLYFSQLFSMKGAPLLLETLRRLERLPGGKPGSVSLDLHGGFESPAQEQRLRAAAQGLEVRFHGPYRGDEPSRTPSDVAVIPTLARESWSFWLDEAGRLGLPIVAFESGAIASRATARVKLVPPGDVDALAAAIAELRDNPQKRRELASAPAPAPMALEEHVARLETLLQETVKRGAPKVAARPDPADLLFEWDRRELAFRELCRSEGWEAVVRDQGLEIERLKRELAERDAARRGGGA